METTTATKARERAHAVLQEQARTLTRDELLDVIEEAQRDISAAHARQAVALAHLSALEPVRQEDGTTVEVHQGLGHQRQDGPDLAAPRLGVSATVAANRVLDAIRQVTRTPKVVAAMAAGELDLRRAAAITDGTEFLDAADAASVVEAIAPQWGGVTVGPLATLVARTAAQLFPDAVVAEIERNQQRRSLIKVTGTCGTDEWKAELPSERSALAWAAVTDAARKLVREGDYDSLTQARADALTDLILEHCEVKVVLHTTRPATADELSTLSNATSEAPDRHDQPTTRGRANRSRQAAAPTHDDARVQVSPASAHADHSAHAARADLVGANPLSANPVSARPSESLETSGGNSVAKGWCEVGGLGRTGTTFVPADLLDANPGTSGVPPVVASGSVLVCHPATGALIGGEVPAGLATGGRDLVRSSTQTCTTYRIPAAMVRFVRLRDGGCRFPGCTVPARHCDLDHVRPWPLGPTSPSNLHCLCRHHHQVKQRDGWSARLHPYGTVTWRDPTGQTRITYAVDHLHLGSTTVPATESDNDAESRDGAASQCAASRTAPRGSTSTCRGRGAAALSPLEHDLHDQYLDAALHGRLLPLPPTDRFGRQMGRAAEFLDRHARVTVTTDLLPPEPEPDVIPF